jgi:hypothetical protein
MTLNHRVGSRIQEVEVTGQHVEDDVLIFAVPVLEE